tara:strand:+ start:659 stop:955 length:297 start_codon:yes stop_codon:yes gene_type:complete
MEYKKEYRNIQFRVIFSTHGNLRGTLTFAAQPYELLNGDKFSKDPSTYLLYGKIEKGERLEIGFKGFSFKMTDDLHNRLGILYEMIRKEYRLRILNVS